MTKKVLSSEVQLAKMLVENERKVIQTFIEATEENVASVCLEVDGKEHTILIHDEDHKKLCALLLELNDAENVRLNKMYGMGEKKCKTIKMPNGNKDGGVHANFNIVRMEAIKSV